MIGGFEHFLGVGLALTAAGFFAIQYIFLRLGAVRGSVIDLILVTLVTNVVIVWPLVGIVHGMPVLTIEAILAFAGAGVMGSLLGRICMFKSVEIIGASRTAPVVAANVFFATIFAVLLFDESLTALHVVGIVLVVGGVAVISWESSRDADPSASLGDFGVSIALPLLAALFIGIEPIFITLGLDAGGAVLPGVGIKVTAALVGFVAYVAASGQLTRYAFRWSRQMQYYLAAGVTSTFGIIFLFAGLAMSPVVVVVPLLQTAPLIVLLLSAIFLPRQLERVTWRLVAAATVVVIGAAIVSAH